MDGTINSLGNEKLITMDIPNYPISPFLGQQSPQNELQRDEKGKITKGIAQDTNRNGTAGRPCKYCKRKEELQLKADQYLNLCLEVRNTKPIIPFIEELAIMLDTYDENIVNWSNKKDERDELEHPEFFTTIRKLKNLQKLLLLKRTLGRYNPTGAIHQLKVNYGMIETGKHILTGSMDESVQYNIHIVSKKPE